MKIPDSEKFDPAKLALEDDIRSWLSPDEYFYLDGVLHLADGVLRFICVGVLEGAIRGHRERARTFLELAGLKRPLDESSERDRLACLAAAGYNPKTVVWLVPGAAKVAGDEHYQLLDLIQAGVNPDLLKQLVVKDAVAAGYGSNLSQITQLHRLLAGGVKLAAAERLVSGEPLSREEREYLLGETE